MSDDLFKMDLIPFQPLDIGVDVNGEWSFTDKYQPLYDHLLASFGVPKHFLTTMDCYVHPEPQQTKTFGSYAAEAMERMRRKTEMDVLKYGNSVTAWDNICTSGASSSDITLDKIKEIMKRVNDENKKLGIPTTRLRVITCEHMSSRKQVKFPRSKKKRIRRKWAKKPENYRSVPWDQVYIIGDYAHMHPFLLSKLMKVDGSDGFVDTELKDDSTIWNCNPLWGDGGSLRR